MVVLHPFHADHVLLRAWEPGDAEGLHSLLNHPALIGRRYLPHSFPDGLPLSLRQVEQVLERWSEARDGFHLPAEHLTSGQVIGYAEADWRWDPHAPQVAVVVDPYQQRKGYGSEILDLVLTYLFEQTVAHAVHAWYADWNQAAAGFLARHGFQEAGRVRRAGLRQGGYYDLVAADLLRAEWVARREEAERAA